MADSLEAIADKEQPSPPAVSFSSFARGTIRSAEAKDGKLTETYKPI